MRIVDSSKIINITSNSGNQEIYIPNNREGIRKNTIMINGTSYYKKESNVYHLINELIGSYLCHSIELEAIDTKVGTDGKNLFALSELFYKENYEYFYPFESPKNPLFKNIREERLSLLDKSYNALPILNSNMLIKILKLISIDLRMGQTDRKGTNIMFECASNYIDFSKFYDFGCSYSLGEFYDYYKNDFIVLKKDKKSLKELINMYPIIFEYISLIRGIEIDSILTDVQIANGIELSCKEIKHYQEKDRLNNNLLKKL